MNLADFLAEARVAHKDPNSCSLVSSLAERNCSYLHSRLSGHSLKSAIFIRVNSYIKGCCNMLCEPKIRSWCIKNCVQIL